LGSGPASPPWRSQSGRWSAACLTEHINWNWIFFINVPVGLLGLLAIPVFIDESRDTTAEQRLDVPGLATSALGLFSLTYAFIEANSYGWASARIIGAFVVAAASFVSFVLLERTSP